MSDQSSYWDAEPFPQEIFDFARTVEMIEKRKSSCKLVSLNVVNLFLRAFDIRADYVCMMADFLALSETREQTDLQLAGFVCVSKAKRATIDAAGVAILHSNRGTTTAIPHSIDKVCESYDVELGLSDGYGDICAAEISIANRRMLLFCIYISPGIVPNPIFYAYTNMFYFP